MMIKDSVLSNTSPVDVYKRQTLFIAREERDYRIIMFGDGQIHIAKWVRNALDLNDGDELLFEVVDNKIIFTKAEG